MTDHIDPLDDLASAHLDGETTAAEAARVAADPELRARVARLATARDHLRGAAPPVDPVRRDDAVAAALAAFDLAATDPAPEAGRVAVTPITAARRAIASRRTLRLVGIAAAVILLAVAVPLIGRLGSDSGDDAAADFQATGQALDDGGADSSAFPTTTTAAGRPTTPDLGSFTELSDLTDAARTQLTLKSSTASETAPMAASGPDLAADACAAQEAASDGSTVLVALAVLDAQPVVVLVREAPDGGRSFVVLDRQACTTVTAGRL
jgi:hypothetical protein